MDNRAWRLLVRRAKDRRLLILEKRWRPITGQSTTRKLAMSSSMLTSYSISALIAYPMDQPSAIFHSHCLGPPEIYIGHNLLPTVPWQCVRGSRLEGRPRVDPLVINCIRCIPRYEVAPSCPIRTQILAPLGAARLAAGPLLRIRSAFTYFTSTNQ